MGDAKCKRVVKKANKDNMFEGKHSIRERSRKFPQQLGKNRILIVVLILEKRYDISNKMER